MLKNPKGSPLSHLSALCDCSKFSIFVWYYVFSILIQFLFQYCPIFLNRRFFGTMRLFLICFYRSPLSIFTRNKKNCEHRRLLRVFGTMRHTGDTFRKFFVIFCFFEVFGWANMVFCCFPFSSLMRIHSGIFWHYKFDEILTGVSSWICNFFTFSKLERSAELGRSRLFYYSCFRDFEFYVPNTYRYRESKIAETGTDRYCR